MLSAGAGDGSPRSMASAVLLAGIDTVADAEADAKEEENAVKMIGKNTEKTKIGEHQPARADNAAVASWDSVGTKRTTPY